MTPLPEIVSPEPIPSLAALGDLLPALVARVGERMTWYEKEWWRDTVKPKKTPWWPFAAAGAAALVLAAVIVWRQRRAGTSSQ